MIKLIPAAEVRGGAGYKTNIWDSNIETKIMATTTMMRPYPPQTLDARFSKFPKYPKNDPPPNLGARFQKMAYFGQILAFFEI